MAAVNLTVVGCSPAWPNPGGACSGYLVEGEGSLLVDCGAGVLARLREPDKWPEVDAILVTHLHLDHCGDLVPWVWGSDHLARAGVRPSRPRLLLPPGGRDQLGRFGELFGTPEMFERAFAIDDYEAEQPFEVAGFTVTAALVPHYDIESCAVRVANGSRAVAYSSDTGPSPKLVELARNADLFVCEATLPSRRGNPEGPMRGHLSLEEAEEIFERSGAKRLLVTHRPSDLPVPTRHELAHDVGSSRVDLQACKLEYSIVSPK